MEKTRSSPGRLAAGVAIGLIVVVGLAITLYSANRARPAVGGVYGSAVGMDTLANTVVGGPSAYETAFRFRATSSSALESIRIYVQAGDGYGAGSLGLLEATIETNAAGNVPSGTVLATAEYEPEQGAGELIDFEPAPTLTSGVIYHVVFRNVHQEPELNYVSVNAVITWELTTPRQPLFEDLDWGQSIRSATGEWEERAHYAPIMELSYADGSSFGLGYMEVWVRSPRPIGGQAMVRESFTVSSLGRIVASVSVRLLRISGSSPLEVRLERSDGTAIEEGVIPAANVPIGVIDPHEDSEHQDGDGHATWVTYRFAQPHTLESGGSFALRLSAGPDTQYSIFVIRQGSSYRYGPSTYFADGSAEFTSDGEQWRDFTQDGTGRALDQGDLQFYFE